MSGFLLDTNVLSAGGADVPFFGMPAPLSRSRGAYIPTKTVGTYAPPVASTPPYHHIPMSSTLTRP